VLLSLALLALSAALVPLKTSGDVIPGEYIVVFKPEVSYSIVTKIASTLKAEQTYHIRDFKAMFGVFPDRVIDQLRQNSLVSFIEANQVVRAFGIQTGATWGIDRVDQEDLPLDTLYHYYDSAGSGVDAYIVDTGIRTTHVDFTGRARSGYNFHDNIPSAEDDNGHGTHVASTTGGEEWGIAKNCTLIAVKVLGRLGSGSTNNVIAGVEYTAEEYQRTGRPSVSNLSLGGSASLAMDNAINAAVDDGVSFALASGNSNANACNYSPARTGGANGKAVTVNACTRLDARASFSNFGTCTDLFAPGESITAAWYTSNTATNTISGTSMASPHVCGAMALLLGEDGYMTPAQVKTAINSAATPNAISNPGTGSPNRLLYTPY